MISIVMASYNHAAFIQKAVESVLSQSYAKFEFLIADDGSSDGSQDILSEIKDPRIVLTLHPMNRGAVEVTNELLTQAKGDLVAIMNSDDVWDQDKLARQYTFLEKHVDTDLVFARPRFVDAEDTPISESKVPGGSVFRQLNRSKGEWLRHFFVYGNCLCHPTILAKRHVYDTVGKYKGIYRQLPDFEIWIRIVKKYRISVMEDEVMNYRYLPGENASSQHARNGVRTMNEHFLIASSFFDDVDIYTLDEGFGDILPKPIEPSRREAAIEKALLYFVPNKWFGSIYQAVGMLKLNELYHDCSTKAAMKELYGIDDRALHKILGDVETFRSIDGRVMDVKTANVGQLSSALFRRMWRKKN